MTETLKRDIKTTSKLKIKLKAAVNRKVISLFYLSPSTVRTLYFTVQYNSKRYTKNIVQCNTGLEFFVILSSCGVVLNFRLL